MNQLRSQSIVTQPHFMVCPMTREEANFIFTWAESEGWNPGNNDAHNYYTIDPDGFLIGKLNGIPISCISVVRYNPNFSFIGMYIVKPEFRRQGYGLKTFQEAIKLLDNKPAALDAVFQQVDNYKKWGFKVDHLHLRYGGVIQGQISQDIIELTKVNFDQLCAYDSQYFPHHRSVFLESWIKQPNSKGYAVIQDNKILGYGVIRKSAEGFKIAPLFSENKQIAEKLLLALSTYGNNHNIYIDVPDINREAIRLVQGYQMKLLFECVRMYTHQPPLLNWNNIFGVTSLEIG